MERETVLFSQTTILATLAFLLFLYALLTSISRRRTGHINTKKAPPEAGGALPLIGHLHLLGGPQPPHVTMGEMADKYGPVFTIRIGVHNTLVISNSEMAKECFTENDRVFASRPKSVSFEVLGYNFSMIAFSPYGPYWRHVRKIATLEVLSAHRIQMLKHVMESEVKTAIKDSYDLWVSLENSDGGERKQVTEMQKWFGDITLNVLFRTVVGKRFGGRDNDGDSNEQNQRIRKALRELFDLSGSFVVSDALPFLRWLDLDRKEKAMRRTIEELDYFVRIWLEEHKCKRDKKDRHDDFMDVLLSIVDQDFDGRDADTIIKATSLALILAGTDTTTVTLTWILSLLLNSREVLNKAIEELDTHIGREKMVVDELDLKNLVYLHAIVKETLRLYPAAPLGVPHESMEECTVGGYSVPAGTQLFANLSKIHRDPTLYDDPLEFRPERFLTTHKSVDLRGQHFELIPFGTGRRMCPGMSFGLQMVHLTLANILRSFEIVTADGKPVDMAEQVGLTNIKASPLHVILTPRVPAQVFVEN